MKTVEVTARNGKEEGAPSATISIQAAETAAEAIQAFGDQAVISNANANWIITVQSAIRRLLKTGVKPEDIQAKLGGVKMGVAIERVAGDPKVAMISKFAAMSPEEKAAFIKELQGIAKK